MTKQVNAYQKFIRTSPRKLRLIADMVRSLKVDQALVQLQVAGKTAAEPFKKALTQARANAVQVGLRPETLIVKTVMIEEGPTFKRWQPVSRGRAHSIFKRSSHIKLTLEGNDQEVVKNTSTKSTDQKDQQKGK